MVHYLNIQVAYGTDKEQKVIDLYVKPGTTILQAIEESRITEDFKEINLQNLTVGVYSKIKPLTYVLK